MDECKWSHTKDGKHREFILPGPFAKAEGKKVCQDCCRFLGWHNQREMAPGTSQVAYNSKVTSEDRDTIFLLQAEKLTDWETKFVSDISKRHEWSEKQRVTFERVKSKYFTSKPSQEKKIEPASTAPSTPADDFYVPF